MEGVASTWSTPGRSDEENRELKTVRAVSKVPNRYSCGWQTVLPQGLTLEPRSVMIMTAKHIDQRRRSVSKTTVARLVHAQPTEKRITGIYTAPTIPKIFGSSDLVDTDRKPALKGTARKSRCEILDHTDQLSAATHPRLQESTDSSMTGRTPRSAYCVAQLLNTSKEDIKLQAGTTVA